MPYRLIDDHISIDTVEAFEAIAEAARRGEVIGAGFIVMLRKRRFVANVCGEAARDPVLTRGALRSLDDQLRELVIRRPDPTTTL